MNYNEAAKLLKQHNQLQLLQFFDELSPEEKEGLLCQIDSINWNCFSTPVKAAENVRPDSIDILNLEAAAHDYQKNEAAGMEAIKAGKLCLLLLAGGQGTRLGYNMPKGTYNMGITHELFIFELLSEHMLDVVHSCGAWIHLYIMTSDINNCDTISFWKSHKYFGYNPDYIHFFIQEMNPATDLNGKILLSSKGSISFSPNGNGGWFSSLNNQGILGELHDLGIEWINVFSVDNVLQRIADPAFFGATLIRGFNSGAKVVKKAAPDEKVGAICSVNGRPHIIEYYELSDEWMHQRNSDGTLSFGYGVILNYLFKIDKLEATLNSRIPLHTVQKVVPYIDENGDLITPSKPNAFKYETLALDLIRQMDNCLPYEVDRDKEFAPVKNKTGVDSVATARLLLQKNGYQL